MVIQLMDAGGFDLVILDGEAAPVGGPGIAVQLKDELTIARPSSCSPAVRTTRGWPTGHGPRRPFPIRSIRSAVMPSSESSVSQPDAPIPVTPIP